MASISLCILLFMLGAGAPVSSDARRPEASSRQHLRMSVTFFGLGDSPADTVVAEVGENQMFAAHARSECGGTRSIGGRIVAGRGGKYHATLVLGSYDGWERSSMQAIALELVPGKPFGWTIFGGIGQSYSVTLLRTPVDSPVNTPAHVHACHHVGAELAHAAERAHREFVLDP